MRLQLANSEDENKSIASSCCSFVLCAALYFYDTVCRAYFRFQSLPLYSAVKSIISYSQFKVCHVTGTNYRNSCSEPENFKGVPSSFPGKWLIKLYDPHDYCSFCGLMQKP